MSKRIDLQHAKTTLLFCLGIALVACSGAPQVTTTQKLSQAADAPYDNLLVVSLFESFEKIDYASRGDYSIIVDEAEAITRHLSRDGLIR